MTFRRLAIPLLWIIAVGAAGCDRSEPANPAGATPLATAESNDLAIEHAGLRIVSLSPAITRTLVDVGLGDQIVGRSSFCEGIDMSIPVAGDLLDIDYEMIVRLQPTQVLVQPPSTGTDPRLTQLADDGTFALGAWRLNGIDDIRGLIRGIPRFLCPPGDDRDRLAEAARELIARMDETFALAPAWSGRTLLISGTDPVLIYGDGSYLSDVLELLGGENASTAVGWATLSLEDVVRLDPEAIVLVQPGAPDHDVTASLGPLATLDIRAVRDGRVGVLRSPGADTPSSAIIETAQELAGLLGEFGGAGS